MGYTNFGKLIRKWMIDNDENLSTLANLFNVSIAFVSTVLIGKKQIPEEWLTKICEHYDLNDIAKVELFNAYCETKNSIKLDLSNENINKKKLALQFQRKLPELSDSELQSISMILGKEES